MERRSLSTQNADCSADGGAFATEKAFAADSELHSAFARNVGAVEGCTFRVLHQLVLMAGTDEAAAAVAAAAAPSHQARAAAVQAAAALLLHGCQAAAGAVVDAGPQHPGYLETAKPKEEGAKNRSATATAV
eukprot:6201381-Pleurochrysis_carterae.AAC.1